MKRGLYLIVLLLVTYSMSYSQSYQQIHNDAIVVDLHNDAIGDHIDGRSIEKLSRKGHVDLDRIKKGGVDITFFAMWPDPRKYQPDDMFTRTVQMLDSLHAVLKRNSNRFHLLKHPGEINTLLRNDKSAIGIGIEGGSAIEGDLTKLDYFFNRGVRYITLTWNNSNNIATSSQDEQRAEAKAYGGLTEFGTSVIHRMNELGMMIDLSHAGPGTVEDVLKTSTRPVIVSHSNVYALCKHHRNLKDAQIINLAQKRGVLFINFSPNFLKDGFYKVYMNARKQADAIEDSIEAGTYSRPFDRAAFIHQHIDPIYPSVKDVADHIDYVVRLVGDDYVGIGSDFDGIPLTPAGLSDISRMPNVTKELVSRGYSKESIEKILGGNFIRVFKEISDHD